MPKPNQGSVPAERPSYAFKKEIKKLTVPTGQLNTNHISVKKFIEDQKADYQENGQPGAPQLQNDFTYDHLHMAWKSYAFKVKENGQETIFSAMTKREPVLTDVHHIEQTVDNQVQLDYMQNCMFELENYLRKELRNYSVKITFKLTENTEDVKFLSGKEKFAAMARKNPSLHTLKSRFDLDIEY